MRLRFECTVYRSLISGIKEDSKCILIVNRQEKHILLTANSREINITPDQNRKIWVERKDTRLHVRVQYEHEAHPHLELIVADPNHIVENTLAEVPGVSFTGKSKLVRTAKILLYVGLTLVLMVLLLRGIIFVVSGELSYMLAMRIPANMVKQLNINSLGLDSAQLNYKPPADIDHCLREKLRVLTEEDTIYEFRLFFIDENYPNAFALPSGDIIFTDEIIKMAQSLDNPCPALTGVLAHEIAHVRFRHGIQNIIQANLFFIATALLIGDISAITLAISDLASLSYSRRMELEADKWAACKLKELNLPATPMAELLRLLTETTISEDGEKIPEWLSTHPAYDKRFEVITGNGEQCD